MKCAGLIFDSSPHYIDHLAPYCSMNKLPLIVCEPDIAEACRNFYPALHLIETSLFELGSHLPDTIISCDTKRYLESSLRFLNHSFEIIWLPHGQSDKGWIKPNFEALDEEKLLLVYGERMKEVLQIKNIAIPTFEVGSFRLRYFQTHRSFYDSLLNIHIGPEPFILYAPTWEDGEHNGMFWETIPHLFESPARLLVKLHPNTLHKYPAEIERLKGKAPANLQFLDHFPPIYPLLSRASAYIGDRSSIGYDFLHFDKPLFFLTRNKCDPLQDPSAYLMQCGDQIYPSELLALLQNFPSYQRSNILIEMSRRLLNYSFFNQLIEEEEQILKSDRLKGQLQAPPEVHKSKPLPESE